jgi:hypothetical protein
MGSGMIKEIIDAVKESRAMGQRWRRSLEVIRDEIRSYPFPRPATQMYCGMALGIA